MSHEAMTYDSSSVGQLMLITEMCWVVMLIMELAIMYQGRCQNLNPHFKSDISSHRVTASCYLSAGTKLVPSAVSAIFLD